MAHGVRVYSFYLSSPHLSQFLSSYPERRFRFFGTRGVQNLAPCARSRSSIQFHSDLLCECLVTNFAPSLEVLKSEGNRSFSSKRLPDLHHILPHTSLLVPLSPHILVVACSIHNACFDVPFGVVMALVSGRSSLGD